VNGCGEEMLLDASAALDFTHHTSSQNFNTIVAYSLGYLPPAALSSPA